MRYSIVYTHGFCRGLLRWINRVVDFALSSTDGKERETERKKRHFDAICLNGFFDGAQKRFWNRWQLISLRWSDTVDVFVVVDVAVIVTERCITIMNNRQIDTVGILSESARDLVCSLRIFFHQFKLIRQSFKREREKSKTKRKKSEPNTICSYIITTHLFDC